LKRLILCLGNEIAGDDGVGIYIGKKLKGWVKGWEVKISTKAGFYLLEDMEGYEEVILVDSLISRGGRVGEIVEGEFSTDRPGTSPHLLSLPQALALGKQLGLSLPHKIRFLAITIPPPSFGEGLSKQVREAAERALKKLSSL